MYKKRTRGNQIENDTFEDSILFLSDTHQSIFLI